MALVSPVPDEKKTPYPPASPSLRLPVIEKEILEFWERDETFIASVNNRAGGDNEFVFYDGPPFANGLPHYGHLLTGFVKDAVPRYQTMRGRKVVRRFGWDCHGLPAEMAAEKELTLAGRNEVIDFGIGKFNDYCRGLVQRTTNDWHRYVTRQARWVDFTNDYKTMDTDFMESVTWAFAELYRRGLIYEGERVLPYCWECETPLSNFETRQDDSYRPRVDPAVTVAFRLLPEAHNSNELLSGDVEIWAWTTTPWTLPSNLALAVGPDIDYAVLAHPSRKTKVILASATIPSYAQELEGATLLGQVKGIELQGRHFEPIFDYFADTEGAFRVLVGDFIATEEGTGAVQMAPGFGEDDQKLCEANGIAVVCPVDSRARFVAPVDDYVGQQVFEANAAIVEALINKGLLIGKTDYEHSYPHCWRTDTPLIYKAESSWFVSVTAIKDALLKKNQEINWTPAHVKDGAFGKWLEGARDWSLTRNRFWGSPIPVWKSDDPAYPRIDVYGSLDELEADFGMRPTDLHRPEIDELVRPNPDDPSGRSMMRRVPDVLDCWFESGSMPYAQLHYPFENRETFESHFPADFIVEYIGQTRGWFYTLHVLAVALFDRPPFKNCIAHGILLGSDGRKLSKRLGNYPDPWEVFEEIGADAMRWFLLSSSVLRGQDAIVDRASITDALKRVINPIWNAYYFLTLYGNADAIKGSLSSASSNLLDRYILAKTQALIESTTDSFDAYDLYGAATAIEEYLDALTNWYIRRSRDRFWREAPNRASDDEDKLAAYNTLHSALYYLTTVAAPLLPMTTEYIFRAITGERSVHLTDWPHREALVRDVALVEEMDLVREACSQAHSIRKAQGLRARLPLRSLTIATPGAQRLAPFVDLIASETNVKEVRLVTETASHATETLTIIPREIGPRLGQRTQSVINAAKAGEWSKDEKGNITAGGIALRQGEYKLTVSVVSTKASRPLFDRMGVVTLDIITTPELEAEGTARDFVRAVQNERKAADLEITDHIEVTVTMSPDSALLAPIRQWRDYICAQTLAGSLQIELDPTYASGDAWQIRIVKAA